MPRLVFCPTAARVAATPASTRAPIPAPARARPSAETSALRAKSATSIRCPAA